MKFISKEEGVEGIIARALLVGNLQAAVECCLRSNRYADALVLAACGGSDLWSYARETYFKSQGVNNPFTTLISKVVKVSPYKRLLYGKIFPSKGSFLYSVSLYTREKPFIYYDRDSTNM